jgi:hypothetical protein
LTRRSPRTDEEGRPVYNRVAGVVAYHVVYGLGVAAAYRALAGAG